MSSNVTSTTKSTVSSIIKDNYLANGRELPTPDKSSLITSLNYNLSHLSGSQLNASANSANSSSSSGGGNGHLYQNVSNFKQIQNLLQQSNGGLKMNQPGQVPPVPSTPVPTTTPVAPSNGPVTNGHVATTTPASSQAVTVTATSTTPLTAKLSAMCKSKALDGYVGFANLPNQVYRKAVKKGFEFNLMVIGESGLGKSTFINSLFLTELYTSGGADSEWPGTFDRRGGVLRKTTCVESTSVTLVEKNVNLKLTVVDTPGYGESIDNTNCWQSIIDHIDSKYEDYLGAESKISRKLPINDQRVHCCLHFIAPGHT
jgi:septin 7